MTRVPATFVTWTVYAGGAILSGACSAAATCQVRVNAARPR